MKLSTPRYSCCLFFQLGFLFCDLIFNCVTLFPRSRDGLLVLFVFQDLFVVLSMTMMLMTFFSTYLFQAGLAGVAWRRWRGVGGGALYLCLTLALHAAWLLLPMPTPQPMAGESEGDGASQPSRSHSPPLLTALLTAQRCLAPCHYYLYKRLALRAADPRLYEDMEWLPTR